MTNEQRQLLEELAKIMKVQGIASGGRNLSYYDEDSGVDFDPKNLKASLAELNKQFKATSQKLKANNKNLDNVIKRTTERAFESIVSRVTRSLPTRNNVIRRMDDVFDGLEDSVDEFDKALGTSTKRLLREFNGNLNELSKVKRAFGSVVQDMNKFSNLMDFGKPKAGPMQQMANTLSEKIEELQSNGLKELADTIKPTLATLNKILSDSKDRDITEAEMDELRKAVVENLPRMAAADAKMTHLMGRFISSQQEQSAEFANTMKGAIALIGNDIRRLPSFITSEATTFQGGGFSPSNWMEAFSQGMSPQDANQMHLRYMVLQANGQEAFNNSINDINADLRNTYGLVGQEQTQMRNAMLDVVNNLGMTDNNSLAAQVQGLTQLTEGVAKREGIDMQAAATAILDISNEAYVQARLSGKSDSERADVLKDELDTRSRLNKQLGITFEMQKQLNREQRSKMFQGYAEKLSGGIRARVAAKMMGATDEEAGLLELQERGGVTTAEQMAGVAAARQRIMPMFEAGLLESSQTGRFNNAAGAMMVAGGAFNESVADQTLQATTRAQQYARTTASGDNAAYIGATGTGSNDAANAFGGLDKVSLATMYVNEVIYAAGASPIASMLGGAAGGLLDIVQTALLLRGGAGGMLSGAGGALSRAGAAVGGSAAGRGAASLVASQGGAIGGSIAARGGLVALGTVGAGVAGGAGALYAGYNNFGQMFNPETEGKTREEITDQQISGTMKNAAIIGGGIIGAIGGPIGIAVGAGVGAIVGELGEAVSGYMPDWLKMLTPIGLVSQGLENGLNQWKELTDTEGNVAELARLEDGILDGSLALNRELIDKYANLSDHQDGFWGGSTYTSSAETAAAQQKLNAIYAAESGKMVTESGDLVDAPQEMIEIGKTLVAELRAQREDNNKNVERQEKSAEDRMLHSEHRDNMRAVVSKLRDDAAGLFNVGNALQGINLG